MKYKAFEDTYHLLDINLQWTYLERLKKGESTMFLPPFIYYGTEI